MSEAEPHMVQLQEMLNDEERRRAERYRVPGRGDRFIVARAVLRSVLGRVVGVNPGEIVFAYGKNGKPSIGDGAPFFNASDSGNHVVVALASTEIGIDLEVARSLARRDRLAQRICTDRELAAFTSLPDNQKDRALLRLWTCKEAGLKAVGIGLTGGVQNVEVEIDPRRDLRLLRLLEHREGWTLMPIEVHESIICTAIFQGSGGTLVQHQAHHLFE